MSCRPHLVLDGAFLAAAAVGAQEVVLYVGDDHTAARAALERALAERSDRPAGVRLVNAPPRYVAGEESAAVHSVNDGVALPTAIPPRPFEKGVGGRPTLVQNVESLAHVALIARNGDAWYRDAGSGSSSGTALLTISGAVRRPAVVEVAQGTTVAQALTNVGGPTSTVSAVLLGGYFGGWVAGEDAWTLPIDSGQLRARGLSLGCGVVAVLPTQRCGVVKTAQIAGYLAQESAQQCGPCVFGLRAIAEALGRIAACAPEAHDVRRVATWAQEVRGRGACRHPDGAAGMVLSALDVFDSEVALHAVERRCSAPGSPGESALWTA